MSEFCGRLSNSPGEFAFQRCASGVESGSLAARLMSADRCGDRQSDPFIGVGVGSGPSALALVECVD